MNEGGDNIKRIEDELKMPSFVNDFQKAYLNLIFTANWFTCVMQKELKRFDITNSQYNVLRILRGQKGRPMNAFAIQERMIYPNSNVTRILDKLVEKELVHRQHCENNRRMIDVSISEKGLEVLAQSEQLSLDTFEKMREALSEQEARQLNDMLDRLRMQAYGATP